jgi:acetate kinase
MSNIAVINAGSSSIKFGVYQAEDMESPRLKGQVEQLYISPRLRMLDAAQRVVVERRWPADDLDHARATRAIIQAIQSEIGTENVVAVGHRVVHGGTKFSAPVRLDPTITDALEEFTSLAPLHQPHNLSPIRVIAEAAPKLLQVACFDTAFHRSQPPVAQMVGLPRKYADAGIRRYGFHGLSYEYVTRRLREVVPPLADRRIIVAHLGNGASLCAVNEGRSIATTMGFTALDGLLMGTRCGALDPGVLLYLIETHGMDAGALERLLYRDSGLLGVSGLSSDMRELRAAVEPEAAEAVGLFIYRIVREIGSLVAALGGLDGLVFTGGIGENDALTRSEVAAGCAWLGINLAEEVQTNGDTCISSAASRLPVWVVPTDEERMVALHTRSLLESAP